MLGEDLPSLKPNGSRGMGFSLLNSLPHVASRSAATRKPKNGLEWAHSCMAASRKLRSKSSEGFARSSDLFAIPGLPHSRGATLNGFSASTGT